MKWLVPILLGVAALCMLAAGALARNYSGAYIALGIMLLIFTTMSARRIQTAGLPNP